MVVPGNYYVLMTTPVYNATANTSVKWKSQAVFIEQSILFLAQVQENSSLLVSPVDNCHLSSVGNKVMQEIVTLATSSLSQHRTFICVSVLISCVMWPNFLVVVLKLHRVPDAIL